MSKPEPDFGFDLETLLIIPFSWGAATNLGIVETDILGFVDAAELVYEVGAVEVSLGSVVAIASLIAIFVNRNVSLQDTQGIDLWILYATGALTLAPVFPALVEDVFVAHEIAAFVAFTVQSVGFLAISYLN